MQCSICDDLLDEENTVTLECKHILCKTCVKNIISISVDNYTTFSIRCANTSCLQPFKESFVLKFLDNCKLNSQKKKYLKILQDRLIINGKTMIMCPNKSCQLVISFKRKNNRQTIQCSNCRVIFCSECKLTDHLGNLCEVDRNDNLKFFHKNKLIKSCPTCKVPIEKESGCNHVFCSFCNKSFCWLCGRNYTEFHYSIYNFVLGCPGMENTKQSAYIKTKIKHFLLLVLFLSIILGTWVVFQFFISLVVLFFEMIPATIVCGLLYCLLKENFTKRHFVLLQIMLYEGRYLLAIILGICFIITVSILVASTLFNYYKRKKLKSKNCLIKKNFLSTL